MDRSAAYAARYVAKNIVAAGLAERCEVQVSYAIGVAEPTSIMVETFGTGKLSDKRAHADRARAFRPDAVRHPRNARSGAADLPEDRGYGHFGRKELEFTWERSDKAERLAAEMKTSRAA